MAATQQPLSRALAGGRGLGHLTAVAALAALAAASAPTAALAVRRAAAPPVVLVTGATGRTGSLAYAKLKAAGPAAVTVRALVHTNETVARAVLHCDKCDASEGVFFGDVTIVSTLLDAAEGATAVIDAVGAGTEKNETLEKAIEWHGVQNQVQALASQLGSLPASKLKFVLVSSMGTTNRFPPPFEGGSILFWKLQAEAFLLSSGLGTVVVIKPCGLVDGAGGNNTIVTGHDDHVTSMQPIPRADVAAIAVQAVLGSDTPSTLRFDVCAAKGQPTTPKQVLQSARYPWQH